MKRRPHHPAADFANSVRPLVGGEHPLAREELPDPCGGCSGSAHMPLAASDLHLRDRGRTSEHLPPALRTRQEGQPLLLLPDRPC